MKKHRIWVIALALAGLVLLGYAAYWLQRAAPGALQNEGGARTRNATIVETTHVVSARFPEEALAVGTLKSNESVLLRPETSGRIEAIHFKDGAMVKAGSLLISLDAGIQAAELQQAEASLALARANQRRNEDLFKRKFVSQAMLDNTRAALKVEEANVALAAARLAKTRIRAPFDGVVGIRSVSLGDYVKEGEALVNLEDIATLKVDFRLPEVYLSRLRQGLTLDVMPDALPEARLEATLSAIDPQVDVEGRSASCRALLANREGRLKPGMFVRVRLRFGEGADVLTVPEQAIVTGQTPIVFRVEADKAKSVPVRVGQLRGGRVEILDGLALGDEVVVAGQLKIRDGQQVSRANAPVGQEAAQTSAL
jgi:membrane fusion protein (multidrug efflux system)